MDDGNSKEEDQSRREPSTSKDCQRGSGEDLYDDRGQDDKVAKYSESSASDTYSLRSRIDITDARVDQPKAPLLKRDSKLVARKKKNRRTGGRVVKRRRSMTRRHVRRAPRRKPKAKIERKDHDQSVSTIFTRLSSRSGSRTPCCAHCGHRCCRRRFEDEVRRYYAKTRDKRRRLQTRSKKLKISGSEMQQVGSRSAMLSPLFLGSNSVPDDKHVELTKNYQEITPVMIYETLRRLTMWRQGVTVSTIMEYIVRNYPVNPVQQELFEELMDKLRVAAVVGIVVQIGEDSWCLNCDLQNRKLSKTHVTIFWKIYADTLSPITRKDTQERKDNTEGLTNTQFQRSRGILRIASNTYI